jgi:hypothetical protein
MANTTTQKKRDPQIITGSHAVREIIKEGIKIEIDEIKATAVSLMRSS